ncbi:MAG: endonuclease [Bacteroidetes bacterium]|nr:endonuclease [Bacteroidota bacterium]
MKKIFLLLIFIPSFFIAQIPVGYYNSAQGLSGNNLKVALYNIIKNHTQLTYNDLWTAYPQTDAKSNGKVWDIYSHKPVGAQPYEYTFITDQCGNYNSEGDCYNREHSWPQSWFNSVTGPVSDIFHIYPTDGDVNGKRSNYPYGNVSNPSFTSMNGGKLGPCTNPGYTQTVFEPIDEYKGDLARSYFYMTTRYYSEDAGWSSSDATNKATILPWELNVLLTWHHQDPVSTKEINRNNTIYSSYQHNRNPYIDHPEWADSVWTNTISGFIENAKFANQFSLYPNPAADKFTIFNTLVLQENCFLKITDVSGKLIEEKMIVSEKEIIDCMNWDNGIYFISLSNREAVSNFKFIKQ